LIANAKASTKEDHTTHADQVNSNRHFGGRPIVEITNELGEDVLDIQWFPLPETVHALVLPIVMHAFNHGFGEREPTMPLQDLSWFLTAWLIEEWQGVVHAYDLDFAPCVLWDLADAGKPKRVGSRSFRVSASLSSTPTAINITNYAAFVGNTLAITAEGYAYMTTVTMSYNAATAYTNIKKMFSQHAMDLDCMERSVYGQRIRADDITIFHSAYDNFVDVSSEGHGSVGVRYIATSDVAAPSFNSMPDKIQCMWIAKLLFYNTTTCTPPCACYTPHAKQTLYGSSTIIVHRMIHKLRGYDRQTDEVAVKFVPTSPFFYSFEYILGKVMDTNLANQANGFFQQNGVGFNDFKYFFFFLLFRHFAKWSAVCTQHINKNTSGTGCRAVCGGPFYRFPRGEDYILPEFISRMLARIFPNKIDDGNLYIYPVLYTDANYTTNAPANFWHATGTVTSALNIQTGIEATTSKPVVIYGMTADSTIMPLWQKTMMLFGNWLPTDYLPSKFSEVCAASATRIMGEVAGVATTYSSNLSTLTIREVDKTPLGELYIATAGKTDLQNQIRITNVAYYFREPKTVYVNAYTQNTIVALSNLGTLHDKYGVGDSDADYKQSDNNNTETDGYWGSDNAPFSNLVGVVGNALGGAALGAAGRYALKSVYTGTANIAKKAEEEAKEEFVGNEGFSRYKLYQRHRERQLGLRDDL